MVFCFVQNFFSDNTRVRILIFFVAQSAKFFPQFNIRLYDKNSESFYFFFLHQNQNIFFSNIGNQNVFFQVKWSFPNMQFSPDVCVHQYCLSLLSNIKNIFGLGKKVLAACLKAQWMKTIFYSVTESCLPFLALLSPLFI